MPFKPLHFWIRPLVNFPKKAVRGAVIAKKRHLCDELQIVVANERYTGESLRKNRQLC
jgi:hypothetical protein